MPRARTPDLSVVVPLYDEEATLPALHGRLSAVLEELGRPFEIVYVDDGSRDATPDQLARLAEDDPRIVLLRLSRNFGHQAAVTAGLDAARGKAVVVIDGDLQDPPELIPEMVDLWRRGNDVVYAVRARREGSWLKRLAYHVFYRLLARISDLEIPLDSGDFALLDRRVVSALKALPERARFLRGLRTFVGFRQVALPYDRPERSAGRSKYTWRKLLGLALDGLVSFSAAPLRLVTTLGIASAVLSVALAVWALADALATHSAPRGWASTLVVVLFVGAVQLISLGILGEYVRLIFVEAKGRPPYILAAPGSRTHRRPERPLPWRRDRPSPRRPHFRRPRRPVESLPLSPSAGRGPG